MKYFFTLMLTVLLIGTAAAQFNQYKDQIQISIAGIKKDVGMGINVGGLYYIDNNLALQGGVQIEWGRPYQAFYSAYGLDLGVSYSPFIISNNMFVNIKGFATGAYQSINDKSLIIASALNFGAKAGAGLEYYLSDQMAVEIYGLQAFYLKKTFGQKQYDIGLSLKIDMN